MIDSHIHVGQYYDLYFTPKYIAEFMDNIGVDLYAVSSTTICEENYEKVLREIQELVSISNKKALPVLWITPKMILTRKVDYFLRSEIHWKCLKIHPQLCPDLWTEDSLFFDFTLNLSRESRLPLLIHTGEVLGCEASRFASVVENNNDIDFILAHGRPTQEAISILKKCSNAWVDTAFMGIDEIECFIRDGFAHKMLWGTDMFIPKYFYPDIGMLAYYRNKIDAFKKITSPKQFDQVTFENAMKLFDL